MQGEEIPAEAVAEKGIQNQLQKKQVHTGYTFLHSSARLPGCAALYTLQVHMVAESG